MNHWKVLHDAFPDGMMNDYDITSQVEDGEKFKVTWVFSGTHVNTIFGIEPRNKLLSMKGHTYFTFRDNKIASMVLTWNYREALAKLMGIEENSISSEKISDGMTLSDVLLQDLDIVENCFIKKDENL